MAEETGEQIALALENARLPEEMKGQAARAWLLSKMTSRLTCSLNLNAFLEAAVRGSAHLPDVAKVALYVGGPEEPALATRGRGQ